MVVVVVVVVVIRLIIPVRQNDSQCLPAGWRRRTGERCGGMQRNVAVSN